MDDINRNALPLTALEGIFSGGEPEHHSETVLQAGVRGCSATKVSP